MLRRVFRITAFSVVVLLIAGSLFLASWNHLEGRKVDAELEGLRARREPLLLAELRPPPVPDAENAAPLLSKAAALLGDAPDRYATLVQELQDGAPGAAERAGRELSQAAPAARALGEAFARPRCLFPVNYEDGFQALLPHVGEINRLGWLLRLEGAAASSRGDAAGVVAAAGRLLRLARCLDGERTLIGFLVRTSLVEAAFTLAPADPAVADLARAELPGLREQAALALRMERAFVIRWFSELLDGRAAPDGVTPGFAAWFFARPLVRRDFAHYLRITQASLDLVGRSWPESAAGREQLAALEVEANHPISRGIIPAYRSLLLRLSETEARLRMLVLAATLAKAPPAALPPGPGSVDPLTGQPFRYQAAGKGFTLKAGDGSAGSAELVLSVPAR